MLSIKKKGNKLKIKILDVTLFRIKKRGVLEKILFLIKLETLLLFNKNVIVFTPFIQWNQPLKQRFHHFAEQFAKRSYLVIYCTNSDNDIDSNNYKFFYKIKKNIYLTDEFEFLSKFLNHKWFYFTGMAWYSSNEFLSVKKHNCILYDHLDSFKVDDWGTNAIINKNRHYEIAGYSNLALYSARTLKKDFNGILSEDKLLYIPNGCAYDDFSNLNCLHVPRELLSIDLNKVTIGYHGALTSNWIDFQLIETVAKKFRNCNLILIGEVNNSNDRLIITEMLNKNPNLYYFNAVQYKKLPEYIRFFNVGIIPFLLGEIALNTNPIKLVEYMALGIPTVVTRDLIECKGYEYVYVSKNKNVFINNVSKAISICKEQRVKIELQKIAKQRKWENLVDKILEKMKTESD